MTVILYRSTDFLGHGHIFIGHKNIYTAFYGDLVGPENDGSNIFLPSEHFIYFQVLAMHM